MTSEYCILGVDGGGTGCRVALRSPQGEQMASALGGPANFTTDPDATIRNILDALHEIALSAGLSDRDLTQCIAHIGLAGVMNRADRDAIVSAMPFLRVNVSDDRLTSVVGALDGRNGILVAIGTGTIVAAQRDGKRRYFGGWGHHLADQASGGWLGRKALRHAMLAHDGLRKHSDMTNAILERFNSKPLNIVQFAANAEPGDYAALAPTVVEVASNGDASAAQLMQLGTEYLQTCFETAGLESDAIICLAGGVGPHYESYLDHKYRARLEPPSGAALDGALRLAREALEEMGGGA